MAEIMLTQEGLDSLKSELQELVTKTLPGIKKRMAVAREDGDLSENNPWITAKEDLVATQTRIMELKAMIKEAKVIEKNDSTLITVGDNITLKVNGTEMKIKLVSTHEADPSKQYISEESPLGKVILGQKMGTKVMFSTPAGDQEVVIVKKG
jgi:transcription elongation factor GreA